MEAKMVLTSAPRIKPKTKLNLMMLHAPMKNMETLMSLVSAYAVRVDARRMNNKEK